jgi:hypothetical protein
MALTIDGGITIGGGISAGPNIIIGAATFTLSSSDFSNGQAIYQDTTPQGTNGNDGFINSAAQASLAQGYYGFNLTSPTVSRISAAVTAAGLNPISATGYIWQVTWGLGSTIANGLIKFGYYNGNGDPNQAYFYIQTIDPADTDWELPGNDNGTSLAGTFLFPATFTIYEPLINKGGWC